MNTSGVPASLALSIEQAVLDAYQQTSPKQLRRIQWSAGTRGHRFLRAVGFASLPAAFILAHVISPSSIFVYAVVLPGMFLLAYSSVATERLAFGQHFKAYGDRLNGRKGEPSRLRYLYFLERVRGQEVVDPALLKHLIEAGEARMLYRDAFYRRYPILTTLSAVIAMLVASGVSHPAVWSTSWGILLLIITSMAWVIAFLFGREWRALRPSAEAQERELLAFLHLAIIDLKHGPKPDRPATTSDISPPNNTP